MAQAQTILRMSAKWSVTNMALYYPILKIIQETGNGKDRTAHYI